jgi:hypothetical protein
MCLAPQRPDTLMLPPATATPRRPRPLTLAATLTIALTLGATEIATNTREQRTLPPSAQERTTSAVSGRTRRRHRNGAQTLNPSRFRKRRQRPLAANVRERVPQRERCPPSQDVAGSGRLNPKPSQDVASERPGGENVAAKRPGAEDISSERAA